MDINGIVSFSPENIFCQADILAKPLMVSNFIISWQSGTLTAITSVHIPIYN